LNEAITVYYDNNADSDTFAISCQNNAVSFYLLLECLYICAINKYHCTKTFIIKKWMHTIIKNAMLLSFDSKLACHRHLFSFNIFSVLHILKIWIVFIDNSYINIMYINYYVQYVLKSINVTKYV
jgi:hypothetical protein